MDTELIESNQVVANYRDPAQQADAVLSLLASSIERGLAPEALEKLVALQERVMARHAESAFNRALAAFQAECPVIEKANKADTGKYTYKFADLPQIANTIRPFLERHGLAYTFDSTFEQNMVTVWCIVSHIDGHSKRTQFACPIDAKAVMNDAQKFASATTYSRRYALTLALGLITGDDDDCRAAYPAPERDESAPKTAPRGQRETPVSDKEIKEIVSFFKNEFPNATVSDWAAFVAEKTAREFDVKKPSQWTRGDLATCWKVLRGEA